MKRYLAWASALIFVLPFSLWSQVKLLNSQSPAKILEEVCLRSDWKPQGEIKIIEPSHLAKFDARDAAVINEYGFSRAYSQVLKRGSESIGVQIFEMIDAPAAYGLYTYFRNPKARPLTSPGELAEDSGSLLSFVQDRFYVTLQSTEPNRKVSDDTLDLAGRLAKGLPKGLGLPPLLGKLPEKNHVRHSTVFVMGASALNSKLPMGGKDLFGLANGAEAVLANYRTATDSASLLLILYPTQQLARQWREKGYREYSILNPGISLSYKQEGSLVALVIGAQTPQLAENLLDQISYVSIISWDPKTTPLTMVRLLMNIFIFLGILLLIALGAGLSFAAIRILSRRYFPGKIFDRPQTELIRLNLSGPK